MFTRSIYLGDSRVRFSRQQRTVLAALAAAAVLVGLLAATLSGGGSSAAATLHPTAAVAPRTTPAAGKCNIQIWTGQPGSPYTRYADVLANLIATSGQGWSAQVQTSQGTAANLRTLQEATPAQARCLLAIVQLNGAADASRGIYQFAGRGPMPDLRTIGPINYDLEHLIVRADSSIHRLSDLCGKRVAIGLTDSGTRQISDVLLRVAGLDHCGIVADSDLSLVGGLNALADPAGKDAVAAVMWAGGAPTGQIVEALSGSNPLRIRLIPLDSYRQLVQDDWDIYYSTHGTHYAGTVFDIGTIRPRDYPGVALTPTIATPNGVVALKDADPDLVTFVTKALFDHRADLARSIWPDGDSDRVLPDARSVYENPIYCYVPLHPQAAAYYKATLGGNQPCDRA